MMSLKNMSTIKKLMILKAIIRRKNKTPAGKKTKKKVNERWY